MTKNEELKQELQILFKESVSDFIAELKQIGLIRINSDSPAQKTEQILYSYDKFCAVIADKEKNIRFLQMSGIQNRSKSITCEPVSFCLLPL